MMLRKYLLSIHRYGGLAIAIFLMIAALTGSIIAFEHELDAWLNPHLFKVAPRLERLPPYQLRDIVASRYPQAKVNSIDLREQPDESIAFYLRTRSKDQAAFAYNKVFVDPYTGVELGRRNTIHPEFSRANLIPLVYRFHHSLLIPGKWGMWLMGAVALFWTLDCFIGLYLTFPRSSFSWSVWKHAWKIKWGAKATRINYDVHRAFGLWLWLILLVLALSSVRLNLYQEVFKPLVSLFSNVSSQDRQATKGELVKESIQYADAVNIARQYLHDIHISAFIHDVYFASDVQQYQISFKAKDTWRDIIGYSYVVVDAQSGVVTDIEWETGKTVGDTFIAWMFPLHSGKAFGLFGRIVIAMTGIAIIILIMTGIIIWWKKGYSRSLIREGSPVTDFKHRHITNNH